MQPFIGERCLPRGAWDPALWIARLMDETLHCPGGGLGSGGICLGLGPNLPWSGTEFSSAAAFGGRMGVPLFVPMDVRAALATEPCCHAHDSMGCRKVPSVVGSGSEREFGVREYGR